MKLRILDNSIRLRLDRREVRQLLRERLVERRTDFGATGVFVYALHAIDHESELFTEIGPTRIDVFVSVARATRWACSNETSIEAQQPAETVALRILVEKDFPCRHTEPEDTAEKFTPTTMPLALNSGSSDTRFP